MEHLICGFVGQKGRICNIIPRDGAERCSHHAGKQEYRACAYPCCGRYTRGSHGTSYCPHHVPIWTKKADPPAPPPTPTVEDEREPTDYQRMTAAEQNCRRLERENVDLKEELEKANAALLALAAEQNLLKAFQRWAATMPVLEA